MHSPRVSFVDGLGVWLIWREPVGIESLELLDVSHFDVFSLLARSGYPRAMIEQRCGGVFLAGLLEEARRHKAAGRKSGKRLARHDYRRWSLVLRSGGTPWDCVEHVDLVVDAAAVRYSFTDDAGGVERLESGHAEFLESRLGRADLLRELLPAIDEEIRRRGRLARNAL